MKIAVSQKGDCSTSTQSERISSAIPQADRSTDGEDDLVARVVGLGVVAVHSRAVHPKYESPSFRLFRREQNRHGNEDEGYATLEEGIWDLIFSMFSEAVIE